MLQGEGEEEGRGGAYPLPAVERAAAASSWRGRRGEGGRGEGGVWWAAAVGRARVCWGRKEGEGEDKGESPAKCLSAGILWRMDQHAPQKCNFLWRMELDAPQKGAFLWRMWVHAPQKRRGRMQSIRWWWGPQIFCGAWALVRHRKS